MFIYVFFVYIVFGKKYFIVYVIILFFINGCYGSGDIFIFLDSFYFSWEI